jgi:DNA-binding SARP family transcriptional activator
VVVSDGQSDVCGWGVELRLLGAFDLFCGGETIVLQPTAQRVVAFLALKNGSVPRLRVAECLWPEKEESCALHSLRSALGRVRGVCRHRVLVATQTHLGIGPEVTVDVREHRRGVDRVLREGRADAAGFDVVDLLPGWHDEWLLVEREDLRQRQLHALDACARRLIDSARYGEAIGTALAALRAEPLRETAHRLVIEAHLQEGNQVEARRQWQTYARLLRERLNATPSFHWRNLVEPCRSGDADRVVAVTLAS